MLSNFLMSNISRQPLSITAKHGRGHQPEPVRGHQSDIGNGLNFLSIRGSFVYIDFMETAEVLRASGQVKTSPYTYSVRYHSYIIRALRAV